MRIELNGTPTEIGSRILSDALKELGYCTPAIATAVNGCFVPAPSRAETLLRDGDRVEVLAPMQGG